MTASDTERWLIAPELAEERAVPGVSVLRRGTNRTAHGREEEGVRSVARAGARGGRKMKQAKGASVVWCGSVGDRSVSRTRYVQCVWGVRVTKGNIEEIYVFGGRRDHSGWSDGVPSPSYFELVSWSNRTFCTPCTAFSVCTPVRYPVYPCKIRQFTPVRYANLPLGCHCNSWVDSRC